MSLALARPQLYGLRLNYQTVGLGVNGGGSYFRKASRQDAQGRDWFNEDRPWLLSVENPLERDVDVGANAWNIRSVRRALGHSYITLLGACAAAREHQVLRCVVSPTERFIRPSHLLGGRRRRAARGRGCAC